MLSIQFVRRINHSNTRAATRRLHVFNQDISLNGMRFSQGAFHINNFKDVNEILAKELGFCKPVENASWAASPGALRN
jgi:hypothetical protein